MSSRLKSAIIDFVLVSVVLTLMDIMIIGGMTVFSTLLNIFIAFMLAMFNHEFLYNNGD